MGWNHSEVRDIEKKDSSRKPLPEKTRNRRSWRTFIEKKRNGRKNVSAENFTNRPTVRFDRKEMPKMRNIEKPDLREFLNRVKKRKSQMSPHPQQPIWRMKCVKFPGFHHFVYIKARRPFNRTMESEPEEGEIREGERRRNGHRPPRRVSEDECELPRGYRTGKISHKRQSELSQRSSSPKRSRRKSREFIDNVNCKRRSLSGTTRKEATSRPRGDRTRRQRSTSNSRRGRSRSRGSSNGGLISSSRTSGHIQIQPAPVQKRSKKRRQDPLRNSINSKKILEPNPSRLKVPDKITEMPIEEAQHHSDSKTPPEFDPSVSTSSLTAISPTPLNCVSTLENVEDISDEEVAVVSVIHACDRKPELIVLDSSDEEEEKKTQVVPKGYDEQDLETLELRRKALEGLVRNLNPTESEALAAPETKFSATIENVNDLVQNIASKTTDSPEELPSQQLNEIIPDDSEKENEQELELYLLREKLLSDLAKKAKPIPNPVPSVDSESQSKPCSTSKVDSSAMISIDKPSSLNKKSNIDTDNIQKIPTKVTRILPISSSHSLFGYPISTGREHELPTSYSYAPMPCGPRSPRPIANSVLLSNHIPARPPISDAFEPPIISSHTGSPIPIHSRRVEIMNTNFINLSNHNTMIPETAVQNNAADRRPTFLNPKPVSHPKSSPSSIPSKGSKNKAIDNRLPQYAKSLPTSHPANGENVLLKSANDLFSIKRTVINPKAMNTKTRYHRSASNFNVTVPRFQAPKSYNKIVIPLGDADTTSDEDEPPNSTANEPPSKTPVPLPDTFHTKLDNFLKTVRESASQNQVRDATKSSSLNCDKNLASKVPQPNVGSLSTPLNTKSISPTAKVGTVSTDKPTVPNTKQVEYPKRLLPLQIKDADIFEESNSPSPNIDNQSINSGLTSSLEVSESTPVLMEISNSNEIGSAAESIVLPATKLIEISTMVEVTASEDIVSFTNQINSPGPTTSNDVIAPNLESAAVPETLVTKSLVPTPKSSPELSVSSAVELGRTSPVVQKPVNSAQTREELQLREKLLRITLINSEKKLKLTNTEKELIDTRQATTELMNKVLEKVVTYSEKEKKCSEIEKQVIRLKKQLEMAENNLQSVKRETSDLQDDFLKSAEQAFIMRKKYIDLGKACRTIGKQIVGEQYRIPFNGANEMLKKIKEIHKHSVIVKKLKAGSSELNAIEKQVQAALRNPTSGKTTKPSNSASGSSTIKKSLIHGEKGQESSSNQISSDEESWNAFKSQGLTKCLRAAPNAHQEYERETNSQKPHKPVQMKITDVMQPKPLPLGIYIPYNSPISKPRVGINLRIQSIIDPVCFDSIVSTCKTPNCKLQHLGSSKL